MPRPPAGRKPGEALRGPPKTLKYEPRYREAVVEFMAKGYSLTAFAGEIGATRATVLKWCTDHTPFADAVERGKARRARLLEDKMLAADGESAIGVHLRALKAAAPDDWCGEGRNLRRATKAPVSEAAVKLPDNGRG